MTITTIGLDLAKSVFYIVALNQAGKIHSRKKLRRSQMISFFNQLEPSTVAIKVIGNFHSHGIDRIYERNPVFCHLE